MAKPVDLALVTHRWLFAYCSKQRNVLSTLLTAGGGAAVLERAPVGLVGARGDLAVHRAVHVDAATLSLLPVSRYKYTHAY